MAEGKQKKQPPQYNVKHVRMGVWLEEYSRTKSMLSIFRNMRKKKKLNLQTGVSPLFNQLLSPVILNSEEGKFRYGDVVQLVCEDQVLSVMVKDEDYSKYDDIPQGSFLTVSDVRKPCVRNSFQITNPWKKVVEGDTLHYGDDFAVTTVDLPGVPTLFAGADYPFGTLTLKPGHSLLRMSSLPDNQCRFRIERMEEPYLAEGTPVLPNEPFHILSSATHRNLVVNRKCKVLSILGLEQEVSFYYTPDWFTKYDKVNLTNVWSVNTRNIV